MCGLIVLNHRQVLCKTTIEADDEWLHSFYYFNDEIPSEEDFRNTIADYITLKLI